MAYHIKIGNVQIEIGNVMTGNAEIGRMEWPFSATVTKAILHATILDSHTS